MIIADFRDLIAARMIAEHRTLAGRWFERLLDILPVDARDVFPTESLLDHVPALILEIGGYLREPEEEAIAANSALLGKARELGALRHAQRASLHQVLREYQLLSGILVAFVLEELERAGGTPTAAEGVRIVQRLHQAVNVLSQATVEAFVTLYMDTIAHQSERLEEFTRMAAHEWRQPLNALQFGVRLLMDAELDPSKTRRTLESIERNVRHLVEVTHKLEAVARVHTPGDNPILQAVSVSAVAAEAARQLREMADARDVQIRVESDLPTVTVDVGRLELAFVNLLSNAIKYSDPSKDQRFVEVTAAPNGDACCKIVVRDNGLGIPETALNTIFRRFTRAHPQRDDLGHVGGLGLGLSIAEDCVRAIGGHIEVTSSETIGTTFIVTVPIAPLAANR